jgi:hypothetical protein
VQILEVVRLEGQPLTHDEVLFSRDIDMLQVRILTTLHVSKVTLWRTCLQFTSITLSLASYLKDEIIFSVSSLRPDESGAEIFFMRSFARLK